MESQKTADLLKMEQEETHASKSQEAAGRGVLTRRIQQCNDLEAENVSLSKKVKQQGLELKQAQTQVAEADKEM